MIQDVQKSLSNFRALYLFLKQENPSLIIELKDESLGPEIHIPVQKRISHNIKIYIDNDDEFYFWTDQFCASWFPCDEEKKFIEFRNAVQEFLNGNGRIVESFRGNTYYRGLFQIKNFNQWTTIKDHLVVYGLFIFWKKSTSKVVQATSFRSFLKSEYKSKFLLLRTFLNEFDPEFLEPGKEDGAPEDEYDPEVTKILSVLIQKPDISESELETSINQIWRDLFNKDCGKVKELVQSIKSNF